MKNQVTAIIAKTNNNYAACVEELDGFVCTANTMKEIKHEIIEGIKFHIEGLRLDGYPTPEVFNSQYELVYKWDVENLMSS